MLADEEIYHRIALTLVPGIGSIRAKRLLEHFGSAAAIFQVGPDAVHHRAISRALRGFADFAAVERTLAFVRKHDIRIYCPPDPEYPARLKECPDPPAVLYYKGNADLNPPRVLSIVGTRTPSTYGQQAVRALLRELAPYRVLIVSGLADGIDAIAHRYAMDNGLPTIGVLGHGLDTIYPAGNRLLAKAMLERGGLLTEFREGVGPEISHFPIRNRIIAGIPEATVVVESGVKGGSMLTANLALGYEREVFAVPGRITDAKSKGCNDMISRKDASFVASGADIAQLLNWGPPPRPVAAGPYPCDTGAPSDEPAGLAEDAASASPLLDILRNRDFVHLDELRARSLLTPSALAARLLDLELRQVIEALPGSRYRLGS